MAHAMDCVMRPDASDFGCTKLFAASRGDCTDGQGGQHSSEIDQGKI